MYREVKGIVTIDADVVGSVPAFEAMWNRDSSKEKVLTKAKLQIIYHLHNPQSPFATSSELNRMTTIVMKLYHDQEDYWEVMDWFNKYYVPRKVHADPEDSTILKPDRVKKKKPVEDDTSKGDPQFERASSQYKDFLNLVPEYRMLSAAQTAVHRLAEKISDPKTTDPQTLLKSMNGALEDLKRMRELVKLEQDKQQSTRGGHDVRKREDPQYLFDKFSIK